MSYPSKYLRPGVYDQEVLTPTGINIPSQQVVPVLIGIGSRSKIVTNESVVRAGVLLESLTFTSVTGTGDSFAFSTPTVTLTDAGAAFTAAMIGGNITISGATSAANNGTFPVVAVPTATTISYTNINGVVEAFTGTWAVSHTATLSVRGTRRLDQTQLFRILNGLSQDVPDALVAYNRATATGNAAGTYNIGTNNSFSLEMDGIAPITLVLQDVTALGASSITFGTIVGNTVTLTRSGGGFLAAGVRAGTVLTAASSEDAANNGAYNVVSVTSDTVVNLAKVSGNPVAISASPDTAMTLTTSGTGFVGREVHVIFDFVSTAAATRAEVAAAINQGLVASTSLGYGATFTGAASDVTTGIRITSPSGSATSDVRVSPAYALNASTTLFGSSTLDAVTVLRVADSFWSASATWQLNYVAVVDDTDTVVNTNVLDITRVGSFQGVSNFVEGVDWVTGTGNTIDWSLDSAAVFTGSVGQTFDVSVNDTIELSVDGGAVVTIDLNGLTPAPIGYANPSSAAAATAAELVNNINAVLAATYGDRYGAVASAVVVAGLTVIRLTSVNQGRGATVRLSATGASEQATVLALFGLQSASLPNETAGAGQRPAAGTVYFATYSYTKPALDYNRPILSLDYDEAVAQVGFPLFETAEFNPLAIGAQLAFEQGAPMIYTIQIDDATTPSVPTNVEVQNALEGTKRTSGATEIVVLGEAGARLNTHASLLTLVEQRCAIDVKQYCRAYVGMPTGTAAGDMDTPNTYIYLAARTLQPAADSPARGRFFATVPPGPSGIQKDIQLGDGEGTVTMVLNSTYLGASAAGRRASLPNASSTLMSKTFAGFRLDLISDEWDPQSESDAMAAKGCLIFSFVDGVLKILDAITTEGGGANEDKFLQDSTSFQKDNVTVKIDQAIRSSLVGVVPSDINNFITDIKVIIASVLQAEVSSGNIGPFLDANGATREIDLKTDMKVRRDPVSRRQFQFRYWYSLAYPAVRFEGQHSVDAPFFSAGASF